MRLELALVLLLALAGCAPTAPRRASLPPLQVQGTHWVDADQRPVALKGVNLGNWLLPEFWMMGQGSHGIDDQCQLEAVLDRRFGRAERERLFALFRAQWIAERDWDLMPRFGLNLVRIPFIWSLVEDEDHPGTLRADAWKILDAAIDSAEARGMYVVLDLHGAVGGQGEEHHTGCAGHNRYWSTSEFQQRTIWLWEQVALHYRGRAAVAGYGLLNEPWGSASEAQMAQVMWALHDRVRAVDPHHVIILPGHHRGIAAYGRPADRGVRNVAFEMHPYPGHFGWDRPGAEVHRRWLTCEPAGTGVCEWQARLQRLDAAFLVGEFQPWAELDPELAGAVTRASYDTYARLGWASAAWSWKWFGNEGGFQRRSWGLVSNAEGVPAIDFGTASLPQIEALFRRFGSTPYLLNEPVFKAMNERAAPTPW